jgi:hypothetical protein
MDHYIKIKEKLSEKIYEVKEVGIEVFENMEVIEAVPDSKGVIQKIVCKSTKPESEDIEEIKEFELSCLFILSHISSNSIFKKAGIELDDIVIFAAAEGARAGINACRYLWQLKKE